MYVRWQKHKRRRPQFWRKDGPTSDIHWSAVIVENERVKGKPTQKHIAYLAGFTESAVATPTQQAFLWRRIKERLDSLANRVSPEQRKRIEATMTAKIGRPPTKRQRDKINRRRAHTLGAEWTAKDPV
jgi:hypothetical protein